MNRSDTSDQALSRLRRQLRARYVVERRIGAGRMGVVYLAIDKKFSGGQWAIKVLAPDLAKDPILVDRFMSEARIGVKLQHANIVKVIDADKKGEFHFMVMSYVAGENLDERLKRVGVIAPAKAVAIALDVTRALECAHDHGVVHRDLKPSNIRIDDYENVVVMDFGIARVLADASKGRTMLGDVLGTPLYMSPEQADGEEADCRSDLYSLGVILYEIVSGTNPFGAPNLFAVANLHKTLTPTPLAELGMDLPPGLSGVVDRLLAKDPAVRYQTASDARDALTGCLGSQNLVTRSSQDGVTIEPASRVERLSQGTPAPAVGRGSRTTTPVPGRGGSLTAGLALAPALRATAETLAGTIIKVNARIRSTPRWILATGIATLVVIIVVAFGTIGGSTPPQMVRVDASPFAAVKIVSSHGDVIGKFETPFQVSLASGTYTFEFTSDRQERAQVVTVGPDGEPAVRVDFWDEGRTRSLLDAYR